MNLLTDGAFVLDVMAVADFFVARVGAGAEFQDQVGEKKGVRGLSEKAAGFRSRPWGHRSAWN